MITTIKIIFICLIVFELWFIQMLYKERYKTEFKEKMTYMDFSFKLSNDNLILIEKNLNLAKENKKLKEKLNKSKNRVAKVIKEEKVNE